MLHYQKQFQRVVVLGCVLLVYDSAGGQRLFHSVHTKGYFQIDRQMSLRNKNTTDFECYIITVHCTLILHGHDRIALTNDSHVEYGWTIRY